MRRRGERLSAWRCEGAHLTLHPESACALCGRPLRQTLIRGDARLITATIVRVNPSGQPFMLGIAITAAGGARTLCVIEGPVRHSGHDPVVLARDGERIVASTVSRRSRV